MWVVCQGFWQVLVWQGEDCHRVVIVSLYHFTVTVVVAGYIVMCNCVDSVLGDILIHRQVEELFGDVIEGMRIIKCLVQSLTSSDHVSGNI